jgi:hypothetical protein
MFVLIGITNIVGSRSLIKRSGLRGGDHTPVAIGAAGARGALLLEAEPLAEGAVLERLQVR